MTDTYRTLGDPVDERTPALELPLPNLLNDTRDDVPRLRSALGIVDSALDALAQAVATKAEGTDLQDLAQSNAQDLANGLQDAAQDLADLAAVVATKAAGADVALLTQGAARASAAVVAYAGGRPTSVTQTVGGQAHVTAIGYDAAGRVATIAHPVPGGLTRTETYSYDASGALSGMAAVEA